MLHPTPPQNPAAAQVREALGSKVSKERIGTELQGMIDGEGPMRIGQPGRGTAVGQGWPLVHASSPGAQTAIVPHVPLLHDRPSRRRGADGRNAPPAAAAALPCRVHPAA